MEKKSIARIMGLLVLILCFFPMTASAGSGVHGGACRDALGDWITGLGMPTSGNSHSDIKRVVFSTNQKSMMATFTLAEGVPSAPSSERLFYTILIDSDQDPTTGRTGWLNIPGVFNEMGVDYEVNVHYEAYSGSWFYSVWDFTADPQQPNPRDSTGSYSVSRNRVRMSFPLTEIGSPAKFDVVFATWEYQISPSEFNAWDHTPDISVIALGK